MEMKEQKQNLGRLASLDFMRGLIMVLLMLESTELYFHLRDLTSPNTFSSMIVGQFFHNNWQGLNFWDLIQPAFMFMAGISMAYSNNKQKKMGVAWNKRFIKTLKRCGWLIFWGILKRVVAPNWLVLERLDVTDILTQLAFATMIAFLISEWKIKYQLWITIGILFLTDFLYRIIYIPDWVLGYVDGKNIGSYIDWILFNQPNNHYVFINWLPTAVHTISGVIIGKLLLQNRFSLSKLIIGAFTLLIIGYSLDYYSIIPIVKPIATPSFILASLGYCLLILAFLYWWIDVKNHKKHLLFFQVVGMNSIFIYLFCDIVGRYWLNGYATIILSPFEQIGISHQWFLVLSSISIFVFEWYLCLFLYRKKIFFKV